MMNLCKTLPLLLFFVLLSACAPATKSAPTATLQPTASPAPTQPACSTVASEPTPIPGVDSRFPAVRPAVRALREQSASLEDFLNTISWMNSYEDLLKAIGKQ